MIFSEIRFAFETFSFVTKIFWRISNDLSQNHDFGGFYGQNHELYGRIHDVYGQNNICMYCIDKSMICIY